MALEIYDTTLRDGTQQEGISLTVNDKLRVAGLLDDLGVDYIEGGWPGANRKDTEFFKRAISELDLKNAKLSAFGSTRRPNGEVETDPLLRSLLEAETEIVTIVGKTWDYHVQEALRTSEDIAIRMIAESVEFLVGNGRRVFFDAEHFFDGYLDNPNFALKAILAAHEFGAERLVLCDTNGGMLPTQVHDVLNKLKTQIPGAELGVHFHNDSGCAVASSITSVNAGVRQVQGCVNGYGERAGNADLSVLLPDLALKMDQPVLERSQLEMLSPIAHHIAEIVNISLDAQRPYVGTSAFTHKAGLHTSALARRRDAYEHENPAAVGNRTRMVVSELAGKASVYSKAAELGLPMDDDLAYRVLEEVKSLEHGGYQFEAADGSFEMLVRTMSGWKNDLFALESFRVFSEHHADGGVIAEATVKLSVQGQRKVSTGEGAGPVNALDVAFRKALQDQYPDIMALHLTDYRVRVLDSGDGTSATTRVLLEMSDSTNSWSTVSVHENVIEASFKALQEALTIGLIRAHE
jgi:2-isopropylmalate synthase